MNPDSVKLLNDYFRNFSKQRDFSLAQKVADLLANILEYAHQHQNNSNILNIYDLLRKFCYSHNCHRNFDAAEAIVLQYYTDNRQFQDFSRVAKVSFAKCLKDRMDFGNETNTEMLEAIDLIKKFERKFLIPERYQQKAPKTNPKKDVLNLNENNLQLIRRNLNLMNSVSFLKTNWPKECEFWLKNLMNLCLDANDLTDNDELLDSIENFVFGNSELIDVQNFMILERFVLKLTITILTDRFENDQDLQNKVSELEAMLEKSLIIYQRFLLIFNEILIRCNFNGKLIAWLAKFLMIRIQD